MRLPSWELLRSGFKANDEKWTEERENHKNAQQKDEKNAKYRCQHHQFGEECSVCSVLAAKMISIRIHIEWYIGIGASCECISVYYVPRSSSHKYVRVHCTCSSNSARYVLAVFMCEVIFWLSASTDGVHSTVLFGECAPTPHVAAARRTLSLYLLRARTHTRARRAHSGRRACVCVCMWVMNVPRAWYVCDVDSFQFQAFSFVRHRLTVLCWWCGSSWSWLNASVGIGGAGCLSTAARVSVIDWHVRVVYARAPQRTPHRAQWPTGMVRRRRRAACGKWRARCERNATIDIRLVVAELLLPCSVWFMFMDFFFAFFCVF